MKRILSTLVAILAISLVSAKAQPFRINYEGGADKIEIFKSSLDAPVITQNIKEDMRPYLHPVVPPDGKGVFTEIHPDHHPHQTGIYWGLKKVNGRDFFMENGGTHYRKKEAKVLIPSGEQVSWSITYDLLDARGQAILQGTQTWTLSEANGAFLLDLEWQGGAIKEVLIEAYFVGGLFLRMPWYEGMPGEAINAMGEKNAAQAESHRAIWVDVGMEIEGRDDWGHIAVLDHPDNVVFPSPWRVDGELGIGPSRQILGNYSLKKGTVTQEKYRMVIYGGALDPARLKEIWKSYISE
jgi:hypothetical protein